MEIVSPFEFQEFFNEDIFQLVVRNAYLEIYYALQILLAV